MKIRELGERGLISRIHRLQSPPPMGFVGIGDDAAYLPPTEHGWLASSDMLVEGRHFRWDWIEPEQLGEKAVAVNVSDMAAMGGIPRGCLTSLGVGGDVDVDVVEGIYRGLARALDRYGATLLGGDTVGTAEGIVLDVTILGEPGAEKPVLRRGAMAGDRLIVTGRLGAAYAGLLLLQHGVRWPGRNAAERSLLTAQIAPQVRVEAGLALAPLAHAMTDISDGLVTELFEFVGFGEIGAEILDERLPIDDATRQLAAAEKNSAAEWAYYGGEDYELLAAIPPSRLAEARGRLDQAGVSYAEIGTITDTPGIRGILRDCEGRTLDQTRGFNHFA